MIPGKPPCLRACHATDGPQKEPKDLMSSERTIHLNILYYVLSLSRRRNSLYDGIRDRLIDFQNAGFPSEAPSRNGEHCKLLSKPEALGISRPDGSTFLTLFRAGLKKAADYGNQKPTI